MVNFGVFFIISVFVILGILLLIFVVTLAIAFWHISIPIIALCVLYKLRNSIHITRMRNRRIRNRQVNSARKYNISVGGRSYIVNEQEYLKNEQFRREYSILVSTHYGDFLRRWNAKLKNSSKRGNKLYEIKGVIPHRVIKLLRYTDPSTGGEYLSKVPENIRTADEGMAWKFYLTEREYGSIHDEA